MLFSACAFRGNSEQDHAIGFKPVEEGDDHRTSASEGERVRARAARRRRWGMERQWSWSKVLGGAAGGITGAGRT
ncbi:MAG: hypothetical protein KIT24_07600 [Phycisphaeraceae bacterium]|nr:hypothetical protein [Phycisphaeraceae bacterium]